MSEPSDFEEHEQRLIEGFIAAADQLKPADKPSEALPLDDINRMVCHCNKVVQATDMPVKNSGVQFYIDNVCPGCESKVEGESILICLKCRRVLGRMQPQTDPTGFVFKPNQVYHCDGCPTCTKELTQSTIVEKVVYDQRLASARQKRK